MSARATALTASAYTLDGLENVHLADLQVYGIEVSAETVATEGVADTSGFNQVTGRAATHNFELLVGGAGAKQVGLDVSVWDAGGSLIGELQSGTLELSIPTQDGRGIASVFAFPNVTGARNITIRAEHLIPFTSGPVVPRGLLTNARSTVVSDWTYSTVQLTVGTGMAFNIPMVLETAEQRFSRGDIQTYSATFLQRGAPTAVPSGTTFLGVAFSGDALITLASNTGAGQWGGTGVITSLAISFARGEATRISGTLALQGQPTYTA